MTEARTTMVKSVIPSVRMQQAARSTGKFTSQTVLKQLEAEAEARQRARAARAARGRQPPRRALSRRKILVKATKNPAVYLAGVLLLFVYSVIVRTSFSFGVQRPVRVVSSVAALLNSRVTLVLSLSLISKLVSATS